MVLLFLHCLRVHPDIRHKKITLLDDSVRVSKLGLMNICHEQRIVFSSENKKPAVGISSIILSLKNLKKKKHSTFMFDECNKKSVYCVNIKNRMNRIMNH